MFSKLKACMMRARDQDSAARACLHRLGNIVPRARLAAVSLGAELVLLLLPLDQLLDAQETLGERFGTRRAAGNVDVHRDNLVHPLDDRIAQLKEPFAVGAGAHRDDVLRLRHLLVEKLAADRHLVGQRAGDDHQIALARRCPGHRAEAVEVGARATGLHQLDPATGKTEQQIEHRRTPGPVDQVLQHVRAGGHQCRRGARVMRIPLEIAVRHAWLLLPSYPDASTLTLASSICFTHSRSRRAQIQISPVKRMATKARISARAIAPIPPKTHSRKTSATGMVKAISTSKITKTRAMM